MLTWSRSPVRSRAGRRVSELAAATVKRVALELGGKSAAVILDDADLATAVKGTVGACFINSGQTCTAHTRMLVPERLYDQAARLAVEAAAAYAPGDPLAEQTRLGPLVTAAQRERVRGYIRKGIEEGADLLLGGVEPPEGLERGWFVRPTIFGRVTPAMTIAREEIFGPVLSIMTYRDEDDAVRIANGTIYGLAAAVWSADPDGPSGWRGGCGRDRWISTAARSTCLLPSAATSSRVMAGNWGSTGWRSSWN